MKINAIGIRATTLTPFAYHSLMVQGGSATLPVLISDRAIAFGLAATLGILQASVALPNKDYYRHLKAMPYRTSVFTTDKPRLLAPLIRRLNLTEEGGFPPKMQSVVKRGNLKDFFHTQEVPEGQIFTGAIFGFNLHIFPGGGDGMLAFVLAPGAFLAFGYLVAILNIINKKN